MRNANVEFTLSDEQAGYPKTRAALATYDDASLISEYHIIQRAAFDQLFGHVARRFGNLVVAELLKRGIVEIPNIFGPITVRPWIR